MTLTIPTGRLTRLAVNSDWQDDAACRTTGPDAFFSDEKDDQKVARRVCLGCQVLERCLTRQMDGEEVMYRWHVVGGLAPEQRRALYGELLLGGRPNLRLARWLASPVGRYRLLAAWKGAGLRLPGATDALRTEGLLVDEVTVRVALWWAGEKVQRLTSTPSGDSQARAVRMAAEEGAVIRRLRGLGLTHRDVAAYFGARTETTMNAIRVLETADEAAALDVASKAVDAA